MNFFKSVFSDPDPEPEPESEQEEQQQDEEEEEEEEGSENPDPNPGSGWLRFNGLIQTLTTKSDTLIQTYRRDLEEFSSGLKKETAAIKQVAARRILDLPESLEVTASVAQESLESVGQAIDEFSGSVWRGTAEIINQSKQSLLELDQGEEITMSDVQQPSSASKRYSRFEVQVMAIQNDVTTFTDEPENGEEFEKWKEGFRVEDKEEEIEGLIYDNGILEGFYDKLVPEVVDRETFWGRYFFKVYRLKLAEDARASLVKRVIEREEEEELTWEVDDDDDDDEEIKEVEVKEKGSKKEIKEEEVVKEEGIEKEIKDGEIKQEKGIKDEEKGVESEIVETTAEVDEEKKPLEVEIENEKPAEEVTKEEIVEEKEPTLEPKVENLEEEEDSVKANDDESTSKAEDKIPSESGKDSDFSIVSSQPSMPEEDDLGWDEIEDLGENDDKKVGGLMGSPKKIDFRKRLSAAEEDDEDLTWDIEDDDEPVKP